MSFDSVPKQALNLPLCSVLLLIVCLCPAKNIYAQELVNLKIEISVKDKEGRPVPKAQIYIRRTGTEGRGIRLMDINASTDSDGRYARPDTDFNLAAAPYNLAVTFPDTQQRVESMLTSEMLIAALKNGRTLALSFVGPDRAFQINDETGSQTALDTNFSRKAQPAVNTGAASEQESRWLVSSWPMKVVYSATLALLVALAIAFAAIPLLSIKLFSKRARPLPAYSSQKSSQAAVNSPRVSDGSAASLDQSLGSSIRGIALMLENLDKRQAEIYQQQEKLLTEIIRNNEILLSGITIISVREESEQAGKEYRVEISLHSASAAHDRTEPLPHLPLVKDKIRFAYQSMQRKLPTPSEPIYLDAEESKSPIDQLGDDAIYLKQVGNIQGPFVLFADDNDPVLGWVYPNPTIAFREDLFQRLFPKLTEQQFEADKESISPVAVIKIGESRWKVKPQ